MWAGIPNSVPTTMTDIFLFFKNNLKKSFWRGKKRHTARQSFKMFTTVKAWVEAPARKQNLSSGPLNWCQEPNYLSPFCSFFPFLLIFLRLICLKESDREREVFHLPVHFPNMPAAAGAMPGRSRELRTLFGSSTWVTGAYAIWPRTQF